MYTGELIPSRFFSLYFDYLFNKENKMPGQDRRNPREAAKEASPKRPTRQPKKEENKVRKENKDD